MISYCVSPVCVCYVNLDGNDIRIIVQVQRLNMLVDNFCFIAGLEEAGKRGQTDGWEEGVFNRSPKRTFCFCEGRQDELDFHG
jgi:hypothetical protein